MNSEQRGQAGPKRRYKCRSCGAMFTRYLRFKELVNVICTPCELQEKATSDCCGAPNKFESQRSSDEEGRYMAFAICSNCGKREET